MLIAAGVFLLIIVMAYLISPKPAAPVRYITDDSKTFLQPHNWKGTPVDAKGRFVNHEYPFYQNFLHILIWLPGHLLNLVKNRSVKFPVVYANAEVLKNNETLVWLGHSSFFLRLNGVNILIDPNFSNTFIYRRHTNNPIEPNHFKDIDFILLSHDHADHCDKRSLQLLVKNNPGVSVLCGLCMDKLIRSFIKKEVKIITALWYQQLEALSSLMIYFVPARHYSKRVFNKFNSTLWGGFVISYTNAEGKQNTIYYSGDTGYGNHFKNIQQLFHPHIAFLPIAAYKPRWFMHPNHMWPEETLQAFKDCGAKKLVPMHYSTFNLSNENLNEPFEKLKTFVDQSALIYDKPGAELQL